MLLFHCTKHNNWTCSTHVLLTALGNIQFNCSFSFFKKSWRKNFAFINFLKIFFFFLSSNRYWSLHGGNLYSPGPCANAGMTGMSGSSTCSGHGGINGGGCPAAAHHRRSSNPAWNWLPWRPSVADSSSDVNSTLSSRVRYVTTSDGDTVACHLISWSTTTCSAAAKVCIWSLCWEDD